MMGAWPGAGLTIHLRMERLFIGFFSCVLLLSKQNISRVQHFYCVYVHNTIDKDFFYVPDFTLVLVVSIAGPPGRLEKTAPVLHDFLEMDIVF